MSVEFMTVAMFVTLILAITLGHELAFTLAAVATLFGLIDNGFNIPHLFFMYANNAWGLFNNYTLVAIPLFIFMAQLLDQSKVAEALFEALYIVLGSVRGGLGLAVVVVCTLGLTVTEDASLEVILFEEFSAMGTVGLSLGLTTHLSSAGKCIIILSMLVGRIGPLTFLLALGRRAIGNKYSYPEENVVLG